MSAHHYIACDLGAESGRVMLATLEGGKLALEEIHRFASMGMLVRGTRRWDVAAIFRELVAGLNLVAQRGVKPAGISCDSWGVDYVLLRGEEPLLTLPYQYRDSRTEASFERTFPVVPAEEIYARTGIQFMGFNTIFQLHADRLMRPEILGLADGFLLIGDYINHLFSGRRAAEASLASTTQLYGEPPRPAR